MKDKELSQLGLFMQTHLSIYSSSQVMSLYFLSNMEGRIWYKEKFMPYFRQTMGGQKTLPTSVDSQLPSAQYNPYVKVAHFWMAYPDPLHLLCFHWIKNSEIFIFYP